VTITNPGTPISGTKTLTGTGTDGGSGIQSIALQYSLTGQNSWTTACSGTTSPTNCNFDTTTIADGVYDFRTQATDRAGNVTNSTTASPNSRIDNYAPTVTMTDPGAYLRGTVTFAATAADGGGIASVQIQYKTTAGSTWSTLCTPTVAPYQCAISTVGGADGFYDFRAIATDNASKTTTSAVVGSRYVDNTAPSSVTFTNPGSPLSGTVTFSGGATDAGGLASVEFQYLNGSTWTTMCTDSSSPYSCSADTTTITDGSYSMRSLATDNAGNQTASTVVTSRVVDNTAPTVTMTDPGTWIGGIATLGATASDGSGIANVKIQYKPTAGSTWTDVCTDSSSPYTCSLDTSTLTNGTQYDFRAIATDNATRSTTSAVVGPRTVDNGAPTISFTAPASPLRGSISLTSTPADSLSGVGSVVYQYKLTSGSTWTTACTGSTSPWGCSWNSTAVGDESYDLRAVVTDNAGNQTTSSSSTGRIVDNDQTPTATDIQAADGGGNSGKMQVGDTVTFTFSEPIAPASVLSGWNGTSTSVVVRVDNFSSADRMSIWNSTDAAITNLTTNSATAGIQLFDNFSGAGVKWNATMVQNGSAITITFTSLRSGSVPPQATSAHAMQWPTASGMTDLAGNAIGIATVTESGASDADF
jgi:chitinase